MSDYKSKVSKSKVSSHNTIGLLNKCSPPTFFESATIPNWNRVKNCHGGDLNAYGKMMEKKNKLQTQFLGGTVAAGATGSLAMLTPLGKELAASVVLEQATEEVVEVAQNSGASEEIVTGIKTLSNLNPRKAFQRIISEGKEILEEKVKEKVQEVIEENTGINTGDIPSTKRKKRKNISSKSEDKEKNNGTKIKGNTNSTKTKEKTKDKNSGKSEPIDLLSGMSFEERIDFSLSATIPFTLSRYYQSFDHGLGDGFLGKVWRTNLDWVLRVDGEQLYFADDKCRDGHFPLPTADAPSKCPWLPEWQLHLAERGYRLAHKSGLDYYFSSGDKTNYLLTEIRNGSGESQRYYYQDNNIHYIELSDGRRLDFYGNNGHISKIVLCDLFGKSIRDLIHYEYDAQGRLIQVRGDAGCNFDYTYDDNDCLTRWQDLDKTWVEHDYDAERRTIGTRTSGGYWQDSVRYEDDVTYYTDAFGGVNEYHKDDSGRLVRQVFPDGSETHFSYDHDLLLSERDATGATTSYDYDDWGNVTCVTLADGSQHSYDYNERGLLTRYSDPMGQAWTYDYNAQGLPERVTNPMQQQWLNTFDERGLLRRRQFPDEQFIEYDYDKLGQLSVVRQDALSTQFEHDVLGRLCSRTVTDTTTDSRQTRSWRYEGHFNKPCEVTYEDGTTAQFEYDIEGNVSKITNALGEVFRYEYGAFDKLAKQTDPLGATTEYHYNAIAEFAGVRNSHGKDWHYEFDDAGRIAKEIHYDGRQIAYEYDQGGRVIGQTKPDGTKLNYRYDILGRLLSSFSGEQKNPQGLTEFVYDSASRLVVAKNDDATVEYDYNAIGQIVEESINDHEIRYEYDKNGRRIARDGDSTALLFGYDKGQLAHLQIGDFDPLSFAYNPFGQELKRNNANGFALSQAYTATGLLQSQSVGQINRQYQYDALDRLTHINDSLHGQTDYRYDAVGQIVSATQSQNGKTQAKLFGYDSELNLNSIKTTPQVDEVIGIAEQKLHYDTAGRVIKTPTGTLSYDDNGRLQQKTEDKDGFRAQKTRYHWDEYDRLMGVTLPDGERWHYHYDPFGRRVEKHRQDSEKGSDESHVYRWDGDNLIAHEIKHGNSERKTEWIYEPNSFRPLAQINHENSEATLSYAVTDYTGTVSELYDENGKIQWQGRQEIWGKFTQKSHTENAITCDLRYQGQIADKETGLYYNRHRYYDSDSYQYLSSDPIGLAGGIRPNSYVADPVNWVDPLGLAGAPNKANDQDMIDDLVKTRKEKNASGDATFSVARDGNGELTPMRESIPNGGKHAESQVLDDLKGRPKPHTVAVDQIPCSGCSSKIKDAGVDKVIVPQTPGVKGSPKTAVRKAAAGRDQVIPVELNENLKID